MSLELQESPPCSEKALHLSDHILLEDSVLPIAVTTDEVPMLWLGLTTSRYTTHDLCAQKLAGGFAVLAHEENGTVKVDLVLTVTSSMDKLSFNVQTKF
jgi:hypothetical protein